MSLHTLEKIRAVEYQLEDRAAETAYKRINAKNDVDRGFCKL
nr:hypothetical protein [uncultured bacterium]